MLTHLLAIAVLNLRHGGGPAAAKVGPKRKPKQEVSREEKLRALEQPVCLIPYHQTIDLKDLDGESFKLRPWMSRLSNQAPLSLVSIPATHDAGTALGLTGWTRCQVCTIPAQLALGVRGFDIRLKLVGDELKIYHGDESQSLKFTEVMDALTKFLDANPKEFIVMRVREESKAVHSTETFEAAFAKFRDAKQYRKFFFRAGSRQQIPLVGHVRGKIVLLDNYGKLPEAIAYPNPSMSVQDDYDTSDMDKKYREIISKFEDALDQTTDQVWNVNYTSSSTMQVDQLANAKANNAKVDAYLTGKHGNLGLVFMNFPGADLIHKIALSNFNPTASQHSPR